ncbi:hypothetical protein P5673_018903, partial [Acropora cervicornis]
LDDVILTTVREERTALLSSQEQSPVDFFFTYKASVACCGLPGRPSYIAVLLGVSLSTVKRRLLQYGLSVSASYAVIADEALDHIVSAIVNDFRIAIIKE